jgi:hypothetical protein
MNFKILSATLCTALFVVTTTTASVIYWEDEHIGSPLDFLHEKWGANDTNYDESYSNIWNILTQGYQPGVNSITGIEVTFAFADDKPGNFEGAEIGNDGDIEEYVDISLGTNNSGTQIVDNREVDGRHPYATYEFFTLTLNPATHTAIFSELNLTGKLKYDIRLAPIASDSYSSSSGYTGNYLEDTYFKVAKIRAYQVIPDDSPNVPDHGSTLLCLGVSFAGLLGLRKKLAA